MTQGDDICPTIPLLSVSTFTNTLSQCSMAPTELSAGVAFRLALMPLGTPQAWDFLCLL